MKCNFSFFSLIYVMWVGPLYMPHVNICNVLGYICPMLVLTVSKYKDTPEIMGSLIIPSQPFRVYM